MAQINAWDVFLDGKCIDTVFFDSYCDADYVRRCLVDHDGYDSRIKVRKG
jgi:hypothetical protein